jgi:hypothetical protein
MEMGILEEAIENIAVNMGLESSDESEDSVSTHSQDRGSAVDTVMRSTVNRIGLRRT